MLNFFKGSCAAACLFAAAVGGAHAAPIVVSLTGDGLNYTANFTTPKSKSGSFTDIYQISFAGTALIDSTLSASFSLAQAASKQIVFQSVSLDGNPFSLAVDTLGTTVIQRAQLTAANDMDGFLLTVQGCAGACNGIQPNGTTISARYSGTINLQRVLLASPTSAVPEPGSLALALAALGGAGWTARRRKQPAATA